MLKLSNNINERIINMIISMSNQLIYSSDYSFDMLSKNYVIIFYNSKKDEKKETFNVGIKIWQI